ncbi:hypothetical protein BGZ93_004733, partial [Podila epicladia]
TTPSSVLVAALPSRSSRPLVSAARRPSPSVFPSTTVAATSPRSLSSSTFSASRPTRASS